MSWERASFTGSRGARPAWAALAWAWHHHAKIEQAVRRGDPAGACRWLRAHISRSMDDALAAFDLAQSSAAHAGRAPRDPVNDALSHLTARFA